MQKSTFSYFKSSIIVTVLGLILAFIIGEYYFHTAAGGWRFLFIASVLAILEISISFDNAVVNATVLKKMTPLWVERFLTWGMLIAVFGMRLVFPLLIVSVVGNIGVFETIRMAAFQPDEYAKVMLSIHHEVASFGGAFLLLVALKYFFDTNKEVHWIHFIEARLVKIGRLESIEVGLALTVIYFISRAVEVEHQTSVLVSGIFGVLTFIGVEAIGEFLQTPEGGEVVDIHRASVGMFLYLEVLDASFSFDGVIGAFAVTNNLFIIAIGLGIGAMFVRSLTIVMVEKGTLNSYKFLENGAFWAVAALAAIMFLNTLTHIPEVITGLVGAAFIGLSVVSSLRAAKA
jgi:hypothetical protein